MAVFALLDRLAPHIEREVNMVINSKQEAESLSSKLNKILVGLQDAERKGVTDQSVKNWLKELEEVAYEMDDVLDEWEAKNLELKVEGFEDEELSEWDKVRAFIFSLCLCFKHVVGRRDITLRMRNLSERIDKILAEKGQYSFSPSESDRSQEFKQEETTSSVDKSKVFGRDFDRESLVRKLVPEGKGQVDGTSVITIVGVGGIGKTTLAKLAYNDPEVQGHFEVKGWVSVSDPFDASAVAKAILEVIGKSSSDISKLETLVQRIKQSVSDRRFLLVLDNVGTEDRTKWEPLKNCLHGAPGSRVLVTTRSELVERIIGTSQRQNLGLLSDSDCGTILNAIALDGKTNAQQEKLSGIGIEIAKKCNGLPLAARTLGSMLNSRFTKQEWLDVLDSPLWKYEDEVSDIFRLLNLSYIDLSPVLKRCFSSCSINPKGSQMHLDKLIRIWMAYGYLSSNASADEVQLKGLQYFQKLATRSFFQVLEKDESDEGKISCKMHDIMHDFSNYLSRNEYILVIDGKVEAGKSLPNQKTPAIPLNSIGRIHTFCARNVSQQDLPLNLLDFLKCVRVLILSGCKLEELPHDVGSLIHLRYLDLSLNPLRELPETVSDLYNLQTLCLENCLVLSKLPQRMDKLMNLRHLFTDNSKKLTQFPQGLEKLTGLWTLTDFRVGKDLNKLRCLRNLNQLRGRLRIFIDGMDEATDLEEVKKADLRSKSELQTLKLFFFGEVRNDALEGLQPPPNLHSLEIRGNTGEWLSNWMNCMYLDSLKVVEINGFNQCTNLPPFGKLPSLEKLTIAVMKFKCLRREFFGSTGGCFPKLKMLDFVLCVSWQEWEDVEAEVPSALILPCIEKMSILNCPMLKKLPHILLRKADSLQYLNITDSRELDLHYRPGSGVEWNKISHIPKVRIMSVFNSITMKNQLKPVNVKLNRNKS